MWDPVLKQNKWLVKTQPIPNSSPPHTHKGMAEESICLLGSCPRQPQVLHSAVSTFTLPKHLVCLWMLNRTLKTSYVFIQGSPCFKRERPKQYARGKGLCGDYCMKMPVTLTRIRDAKRAWDTTLEMFSAGSWWRLCRSVNSSPDSSSNHSPQSKILCFKPLVVGVGCIKSADSSQVIHLLSLRLSARNTLF